MIFGATILLAILLTEVVRFLPFGKAVQGLVRNGRKATRTAGAAGISDHWKEKVLLRYALDLAKSAFMLFAALVGVAIPIIAADLLAARAGAPGLVEFLLTVKGFSTAAAAAAAYAMLRQMWQKPKASASENNGYGLPARILHQIALGNNFVAEASFDLEQKLGRFPTDLAVQGRHVFVCGLARAGTTVLMRRFYAYGGFRSLTYRDMPFVLAPNLWHRLSAGSQKNMEKEERAHGDGVMVDFDSPEALEEVFWRVFCAEDYLFSDRLSPMTADEEDIERFRGFVASVLDTRTENTKRYLSKNNNNILRISAIRQAFPEALIVVPIRSPLQHSWSLLRQHERFCGDNGEDPFVQKYMIWLGHHEFGPGHRPFQMSETPNPYAPDALNHWLFIWRDVYRNLSITANDHGAVFVAYEALCNDEPTWNSLAEKAGLAPNPDHAPEELKLSESVITQEFDAELLSDCENLHQEILRKN